MTLTNNDLQAIASLMDTKLAAAINPINKRFDDIDIRLDGMDKHFEDIDNRFDYIELKQDSMHKKLNNLSIDIKVSERTIRKDISLLKDGQETLITILENRGILPKIAN